MYYIYMKYVYISIPLYIYLCLYVYMKREVMVCVCGKQHFDLQVSNYSYSRSFKIWGSIHKTSYRLKVALNKLI